METHIVAFPFPAQGHINPMFQFCKRLATKGIKITLITHVDQHLITSHYAQHNSIRIESIRRENEDANLAVTTMEDYWNDFRSKLRRKLSEIVTAEQISCLVYDSIMPWALEVAREFGVLGASFFTQSCAVSSIYYQIREGVWPIPDEEEGKDCVGGTVGGMPSMVCRDLPTSVQADMKCPYRLGTMRGQFKNVGDADWILFNSFNALELQVMQWMESHWPLKLVGPAVPSIYIDKTAQHNKDHGLNLFKPNTNTSCLHWLDTKPPSSVVYISFGSLAALEPTQMEHLATALKSTKFNFLWVVRESEQNKLPPTFLDETSGKGLVVSWCSQPQVLSHGSIGCFMSHCGWNSTLEALSFGVPMVAMPQVADQLTNAKFVEDVWRVGVRVKVDCEGIVCREEIEVCLRKVMEGDVRIEIRKNCEKWKKLAIEAGEGGGTSDANIEQFVAELRCKS